MNVSGEMDKPSALIRNPRGKCGRSVRRDAVSPARVSLAHLRLCAFKVAASRQAHAQLSKRGAKIRVVSFSDDWAKAVAPWIHIADPEEPIRRRVALKIIKLGMDTRRVSARRCRLHG